MWYKRCREGVLSAKPLLMLSATTSCSFLDGESTMISPCFHMYFVLPWITVICILVSPTLLDSASGQRQCLMVHHCLAWWSVEQTPTHVGWLVCPSSHFLCHSHSLLFSNGPGLSRIWYFRDNLAWFLFLNGNLPFTHFLFIPTLKNGQFYIPLSSFLLSTKLAVQHNCPGNFLKCIPTSHPQEAYWSIILWRWPGNLSSLDTGPLSDIWKAPL